VNISPKCCLLEAISNRDWDGVIDYYLPSFELDSLNERPEESLLLHEITGCYPENNRDVRYIGLGKAERRYVTALAYDLTPLTTGEP